MQPLLQQQHNCWRIAHASRAAFLIDGGAYFAAFREAVKRAKRSVLILSWDIDSRLKLLRDEVPDDGLPVELGAFLDALVRRQPRLQAHVLTWDFAALYIPEREALQRYKLQWRTHRRLHFRMDSCHPQGGCHHQKIVVIDDALAFVGGLDLTKRRWDTPEHRPDDPRRIDTEGQPYAPFHDVQIMVDGAAAAALGELARERWRQASGERLPPPRISNDPWPADIQPDLENVGIAIARTEPAHGDNSGVKEVERLYLDAIAAARHSIYIENQYLTSAAIGAALSERLQQENGPEVLLALPYQTSGWLEQATMDVLRARVLKQLRQADRFGRLRLYYPYIPGLGEACVNVHGKVFIMDDQLVRIGSANLSNRSMGLDTECDLAIAADGDAAIQRVIASFRRRLLGEHLGVTPQRIAQAEARHGSLLAAVESLRSDQRTLKELPGDVPAILATALPDAALIDPERPLGLEALLTYFIPTAKQDLAPVAPRQRASADKASLSLSLAPLKAALDSLSQWLEANRPRG